MIVSEHLHLRVGDRRLIDDATFSIARGSFVAVLGPNGAGKTTLLRTLAGARRSEGGTIRVHDTPLLRMTPRSRAQAIAQVVTDEVFADRLTVRDVVSLGRYPHHAWWEWSESPADRDAVARSLGECGAANLSDRLFDTLSSGERARIWLALALAQETPVLLLDEPTSHLDVRVSHEILALLRARADAGAAVVCAMHDLNEAAAYADTALLLDGSGGVLCGTLDALYERGDLSRAYGVTIERVRISSGRSVFGVTR